MSPFIDDHRAALEMLCRRYRVRSLYLFGSAARDDFDPGRSDVDLLVEFEALAPGGYADAYFGLRESLEDLFGHEVDLVALSAVRNPYMKADIERTRTLLYAA
ncbi:MAG TPA: nucleotidyltransferase domain-containing protein [Acidimicrobiia bacterium]|nr:nucleotidyltransferase domain-containing protein [Acidimicrobiia bacterium]